MLSYLGISGIFIPFTCEANVNATLPDWEIPFTACHELAHQRGFAREDEANYVGYLRLPIASGRGLPLLRHVQRRPLRADRARDGGRPRPTTASAAG